MTTEVISPDLKTVLRRLKLSPLLDSLPERLVLARQQKMPHQDWLLLLLSDEVARRDSLSISLRSQKAHLDPTMHLEAWDPTAKVTFDRTLSNELVSLRFLDAHPSSAPWAWARPFWPMLWGTSPADVAPACWRCAPIKCSRR